MSDERPVVCDTTPLIVLAGVGLLNLLPQLYGTILVAETVVREFNAKRSAGDPDLSAVAWIAIRPVSPAPALLEQLDAGEAATIALAEATNARLVLLDERRGRRIARTRGLALAGTGAVLLASKTAGLIPAIAPPLRQMPGSASLLRNDLWIDPTAQSFFPQLFIRGNFGDSVWCS